MMKERKYKIVTFGCQMNLADSGLLASIMDSRGFRAVENENEADIVILNTCSVREKAETRVFGRLAELSKYKKSEADKKIIVVGCMAQRMGREIIQRAPYVDMVLGTDRIFDLPAYIDNGSSDHSVHTEFGYEDIEDVVPARDNKFSSFITISRGCDNFCTYCIVPYVRGRERSYPVADIVRQIRALVDDGVLEVTLLGQNVNSYRDGVLTFSDLLERIISDTDIKRIRFMTSHPKDMSDRLIEIIGREDKMMSHVHLPLQSGSDRILKKMGRVYTFDHYLSLINKLRNVDAEISITTDLIVGFPTETEEEYQMTLRAVETVQFDSAFMFRYSSRQGTAAARFIDDIPEKEKIRRLNGLIDLQKKVARHRNQREIGRVCRVLVDDFSRRDKNMLKGKTEGNKTILFNGAPEIIGTIQEVKVSSADSWTLHGEIVE